MRRFGLLIGVALLFVAVGSSASWACTDPNIGVSPDPVNPGDPVYYTITNMRSGAWYSVKAGDQVVVPRRQTLTNDPVQASFPMPDMGPSATRVSVQVIVEHSDIDNPDQTLAPPAAESIRYAGHEQPQTEPAQSPAPTQDASPATGTAQHSDAATPAPPAAPPAGERTASAPRPSGRGSIQTSQPAQRHRVTAPHRSRTPGHSPAGRKALVVAPPSVEPLSLNPAVRTESPGLRVRPVRLAAAVAVPRPEVVVTPPLEVATQHVARPPTQPDEASRDYAFLAIAAALAVAIVMVRRRGGGRPPAEPSPEPHPSGDTVADDDLAIEAELQEMVSEERARAERLLTRT